jgi:hypothetical protein
MAINCSSSGAEQAIGQTRTAVVAVKVEAGDSVIYEVCAKQVVESFI